MIVIMSDEYKKIFWYIGLGLEETAIIINEECANRALKDWYGLSGPDRMFVIRTVVYSLEGEEKEFKV